VLDFNGTISDDEPLLEELYLALFAEIGLQLGPAQYYAELAGLSDPAIVARGIALAGRDGEPGLQQRLESALTGRYLARVAERSPVLPGAIAFVRAARERVPVAIASGASRRMIDAALAASGIAPCFQVIVSSDDVQQGKPHPEGYLRALELLGGGLAPDTVWAVEDATAGVRAARAAGLRVVALRTPAYDRALAPADLEADRLDSALLERLFP
jgi:HAD superfamily hydrolase (TIGR01509 family)